MKRALLVLGLVMIGLCGCGIPIDATAHPFPVVTEPGQPTGPKTITVYFVHGGKLAPVTRAVPAVTPGAALEALAAGPTLEEGQMGFETAIETPAGVSLVGTQWQPVATVNLNSNFLGLPEGLLPLAYGQIVYTLTGLGLGTKAVQFVIGVTNFPWPLVFLPGGTTVSSGEVYRVSYCSIATTGCKGVSP